MNKRAHFQINMTMKMSHLENIVDYQINNIDQIV